MIKRCGIQYTITQCLNKQQRPQYTRNDYDPAKLLAFLTDVDEFLDKDIWVRTEGSAFSIYCNDLALFKKMCKIRLINTISIHSS